MVLGEDVVGRHRGFPFYTIGQRKGLGVAMGRPLYVTQIEGRNNRITLGEEGDLYNSGLIAGHVNLMKYPALERSLRVLARIRYKDEGGMATLSPLPEGRLKVVFDENRRAITPGQSVVFYEEDDLVGGGIIEEAMRKG